MSLSYKDTLAMFTGFLAEKSLRMTSQRELILKTFLKQKEHVTAEQLYDILKKVDKTLGHATVYRTLKLLSEAGIARELNFGEGSLRYEPERSQHHDHLVCVKCGENIEFLDEEIEALQKRVVTKYGYDLVDHSLNLYGVCPKCQKKETNSSGM